MRRPALLRGLVQPRKQALPGRCARELEYRGVQAISGVETRIEQASGEGALMNAHASATCFTSAHWHLVLEAVELQSYFDHVLAAHHRLAGTTFGVELNGMSA